MPVYDQGYRHWEGHLSGHALRWLTITVSGIRNLLRNKWMVVLCGISMLPFIAFSFAAYVRGVASGDRVVDTAGTAAVANQMAQQFGPDWYVDLMSVQIFWLVVMCAFAGAGLIARDRESRALELYLARPVTRLDYIIGKFGVTFFFNLFVTLVPALMHYGVIVLVQPSLDYVGETWKIPLGLAASAVLMSAVSAAAILALSSLGSRMRYVAVAWIGLHFFTEILSQILWSQVKDANVSMVSFAKNLHRMTLELVGATARNEYLYDARYAAMVLGGVAVVSMVVVFVKVRAIEEVKG